MRQHARLITASLLVLVACSTQAKGRHSLSYGLVKHKVDKKPTRFLVKVEGKYGYIDRTGKLVVEPVYKYAFDFCGGRAAVALKYGSKYGYIGESGKTLIEPAFEDALEFSEGHAWVNTGDMDQDEWTLIDESGRRVPKRTFPNPGTPVFEGRSIIPNPKSGDARLGYCVIDLKGNVQLELPDLQYVYPFSDDMARCLKSTKKATRPRGSSRAWINEDSRFGFLDTRFRLTIPPKLYTDASDFSEGLAAVCRTGKYGFINKQGKYAVPPRFFDAWHFSEGLAAVRLTEWRYPRRRPYPLDTWAYVDKRGRYAFEPFKACEALPFSEGFATILLTGGPVADNYHGRKSPSEHMRVIDKTGKVIFELRNVNVMPFRNGIAMVLLKDQGAKWPAIGYIDTAGRYIWEPQK